MLDLQQQVQHLQTQMSKLLEKIEPANAEWKKLSESKKPPRDVTDEFLVRSTRRDLIGTWVVYTTKKKTFKKYW